MKLQHRKIRVLITSNPLNHEGGVVNYYNIIFRKNINTEVQFYHSSIGSSYTLFYFPVFKTIFYPFQFLYSFILIFIKIIFYRIDIVQVNPSLIPVPIIRDFIIIALCNVLKTKCIVFFRGWKEEFYLKIKTYNVLKKIFVNFLNKTDRVFVLANSFKASLIDLGVNEKIIYRTTTIVEEDKIVRFNENQFINNSTVTFLYLGRVSKLKGLDELTDAIELLFNNNPDFIDKVKFLIVGHEDKRGYMNEIQKKLYKYICLNCVIFLGRIENNAKYEIFHKSDIYIFPSWSEGCPNSGLEALSSGLFVICTKVGALNDIVEQNFNGIFVEKKNVQDLYEKFLYAINHIEIIRQRKKDIQNKSLDLFSSKKILNFLIEHYKQII